MSIIEQLKNDQEVLEILNQANDYLGAIGYTEHGLRHAGIVSQRVKKLLLDLDYPLRIAELGEIAGYLHDIGNVISRRMHAVSSGLLAFQILKRYDMKLPEITEVIGAIGNHHEDEGEPVSVICSALIIADKSDVHYSRVRTLEQLKEDMHDRVNNAARNSALNVDTVNHAITLEILIDPALATVMEYFEIFMSRMIMARKAAKFLGQRFELVINGVKLS
ncbi:HD domain-containing protein [bacterium]|nr:HD domain-containing protein [bacterium]